MTRTDRHKVIFGQGSEGHGRDSRYWDRDDRRRDKDYNEDVVENSSMAANDEPSDNGDIPLRMKNGNKKSSSDDSVNGSDRRGIGLYNEAGRNELKRYEEQYEASLRNVGHFAMGNGSRNQLFNAEDLEKENEAAETDDEYDDGFDFHDARNEDYDDAGHGEGEHLGVANEDAGDSGESSDLLDAGNKNRNVVEEEETSTKLKNVSPLNLRNFNSVNTQSRDSRHVSISRRESTRTRSGSKRRANRHKFSGKNSSCLVQKVWVHVNILC